MELDYTPSYSAEKERSEKRNSIWLLLLVAVLLVAVIVWSVKTLRKSDPAPEPVPTEETGGVIAGAATGNG